MSATAPDGSSLKFDVVIAGGGFAGVYCAQELGRLLGDEGHRRVALIAEENFMVFQPMLPEVAGSALNPRHVVNPIRRLCRDVTVLRGKIARIDYPGRRLELAPGDYAANATVEFTHLVLSVGGIVDLSRVPGMPEHAYLMKNVGDALRLRAAIIDRLEEANLETNQENQRRLLTIVIVGGGYSGVETAGQVYDFAQEAVREFTRIDPKALRVVLVHSGKYLLPEINEKLGHYTEETLRRSGLEVILNQRVTAMTASRVVLGDGQVIPTYTVVSTVGNAPNPLLLELCREGVLNCEKGRVLVDRTMKVPEQETLWAAGDCAAVPMPPQKKRGWVRYQEEHRKEGAANEPKQYCPPTAQFALRQGKLLGRNIVGVLEQSEQPQEFTFTGLGELATVGHHQAVAEIMGWQFRGFLAWWMWRTIYLSKLPGLERKLRVMMDWTLDLFFPRDLALFQSKPTQMIREMHLEKDDVLFHAGDPALSLYVVKNGALELREEGGRVLRTVQAGNQVGRHTLQHSKIWKFTAVATGATTLVSVSATVFETVSRAGVSVDEVFGQSEAKAETPVALGV